MAHVRTQIRDAFVAAYQGITGVVTAEAARVRDLDPAELPALLVMCGDEQIERDDKSGGQRRELAILVAILAREGETSDEEVDRLVVEVEARAFAAAPILALVWSLELRQIVYAGEGEETEQTGGYAAVQFVAEYGTQEGAPETAT